MKKEVIIFTIAGFLFGLVLGMVIMNARQKNIEMERRQRIEASAVQQENFNTTQEKQNLPPGHPDISIDYDKEIQKRKEILKSNPNDLKTMVELANLYIQTRQNQEALNWFEKVIEKDNKNLDSLAGAATIYLTLGEINKAKEYYQRALSVDSYNPGALLGLGWIKLHEEGDAKTAIKLWQSLIEHNPNYPLNKELQQEINRIKKEKLIS